MTPIVKWPCSKVHLRAILDQKETTMRLYETLYLLRPDLSQEEYGLATKKFRDLIGRYKGQVIREDEWGKRELAYPVQKFREGYYILLTYAAPPGTTFEIERQMKLDELVLKYNTIKLKDRYSPEGQDKAQANETSSPAVEQERGEVEE